MADSDIKWDTVPQNGNAAPFGPKVSTLRANLTAFNATYYTPARLNAMSKRDLQFACKTNGLAT